MSFPDLPPPPTQLKVRERPGRSWVIIGVLSALVAILVLWSCGRGAYRNYRVARSAVDQFHQRLDHADYDSIYEDATDAFRAAVPHSVEIKSLETIHQKLGNSGAMTSTGFHVNWQNGHTIVNQVFNTQFAQGKAQEGFIWIVDDGKPHLQSYNIDAPQFH